MGAKSREKTDIKNLITPPEVVIQNLPVHCAFNHHNGQDATIQPGIDRPKRIE
jgi:hypothetical protein